MALGATLRAEREKRGLTELQVADATNIMVQIIREIEEEDFHRIAAAIYGKGFIKLYANLLELDPAPLIKEFEEIYARQSSEPHPVPRSAIKRVESEPAKPEASGVAPARQATESVDALTQEPVRIPAPKKLRAMAGSPATRTASSDEDRDLFGFIEKKETPPAGESEKDAILSIPRQVTEKSPPDGKETTAPPTAPRQSFLDSASQRFEGRPYRPAIGSKIAAWAGQAGKAFMRGSAWIAAVLTVAIRYLTPRCRVAGLALGRLPWKAIGKVAALVLPVLLLFWAAAAGFRSCAKRQALAREAALAEIPEAVVIEQILPPPAGYAD